MQILASSIALAQVIFINVDDIPSVVDTKLAATASNAPPLQLQAAVVRFLPAKATKAGPDFAGDSTLASVVTALAKQGQVNLLFSGDRVTPGGAGSTATFDSVERRPAFSTQADLNQNLTNREFGLRLSVTVRPLLDGRTELNWLGRFMWSSDLLNAWTGEKYLVFGMRVAQLIRPGLFYYESDDDDDDGRAGLNLRALFGKRKEPPPKSAVPDISFLSADDREIPFIGQRAIKPGELIVISTPTNLDPKQPEFIYLLIRFADAD